MLFLQLKGVLLGKTYLVGKKRRLRPPDFQPACGVTYSTYMDPPHRACVREFPRPRPPTCFPPFFRHRAATAQ